MGSKLVFRLLFAKRYIANSHSLRRNDSTKTPRHVRLAIIVISTRKAPHVRFLTLKVGPMEKVDPKKLKGNHCEKLL